MVISSGSLWKAISDLAYCDLALHKQELVGHFCHGFPPDVSKPTFSDRRPIRIDRLCCQRLLRCAKGEVIGAVVYARMEWARSSICNIRVDMVARTARKNLISCGPHTCGIGWLRHWLRRHLRCSVLMAL